MISLIYIEYVLLIQLHSPHTIGRAPVSLCIHLYISFQFSVNYISCLPVNKTNICTN